MHILLASIILIISVAGAVAWWRFRHYVTHYGQDTVRLLKLILEELRRGNGPPKQS